MKRLTGHRKNGVPDKPGIGRAGFAEHGHRESRLAVEVKLACDKWLAKRASQSLTRFAETERRKQIVYGKGKPK